MSKKLRRKHGASRENRFFYFLSSDWVQSNTLLGKENILKEEQADNTVDVTSIDNLMIDNR